MELTMLQYSYKSYLQGLESENNQEDSEQINWNKLEKDPFVIMQFKRLDELRLLQQDQSDEVVDSIVRSRQGLRQISHKHLVQ